MIIDQDLFFWKADGSHVPKNQSAESTENAKPLELSIDNWKLLHIGLEGNSKVSKQTLIGNCSILQFSFSFLLNSL